MLWKEVGEQPCNSAALTPSTLCVTRALRAPRAARTVPGRWVRLRPRQPGTRAARAHHHGLTPASPHRHQTPNTPPRPSPRASNLTPDPSGPSLTAAGGRCVDHTPGDGHRPRSGVLAAPVPSAAPSLTRGRRSTQSRDLAEARVTASREPTSSGGTHRRPARSTGSERRPRSGLRPAGGRRGRGGGSGPRSLFSPAPSKPGCGPPRALAAPGWTGFRAVSTGPGSGDPPTQPWEVLLPTWTDRPAAQPG